MKILNVDMKDNVGAALIIIYNYVIAQQIKLEEVDESQLEDIKQFIADANVDMTYISENDENDLVEFLNMIRELIQQVDKIENNEVGEVNEITEINDVTELEEIAL